MDVERLTEGKGLQVYRVTLADETVVALTEYDIQELNEKVDELGDGDPLALKNKLLEIIAMIDQCADMAESFGFSKTQEQLKRISSQLFHINYDI